MAIFIMVDKNNTRIIKATGITVPFSYNYDCDYDYDHDYAVPVYFLKLVAIKMRHHNVLWRNLRFLFQLDHGKPQNKYCQCGIMR